MGLLGAMSGGGAAMGDIGSSLFKSAMEEERALRVAEYKGTADAKAADAQLDRDKSLLNYKAGLEGGEQAGDWKFNDKTGLFWNAKTGETRDELPAAVSGRVGGSGDGKMPDYVNFYDKKARTTFGNLEGFLPDEAAQGKYQYFAARASQLHKQAEANGQKPDPNQVALEVFREMVQKKILSPSEAKAAANKELTTTSWGFDVAPDPKDADALAGKKASDALALPGEQKGLGMGGSETPNKPAKDGAEAGSETKPSAWSKDNPPPRSEWKAIIDDANVAIQKGADPEKVKKRLTDMKVEFR